MKKYITPKWVRTSHPAIPWIATLTLLVVWLLPFMGSFCREREGRLERNGRRMTTDA